MNGILNICKPAGMSSFKCLSIVKRNLRLAKAGHLGTLDPAAAGVLVLLCGKATKLQDYLHGRAPHPDNKDLAGVNTTKVYRSVFTFGIETDSLDSDGKIIATSNIIPTKQQIEALLPSMIGEIEIEIPKFSAVHIDGNRAYDLARKGIDFIPPKKTVIIDRFELLQDLKHLDLCRATPLGKHEFYFEIECQTGTYIRSLAKLLSEKLGTIAIASTIIRTRVGKFDIKDSKTIDDVTLNDLIPQEQSD